MYDHKTICLNIYVHENVLHMHLWRVHVACGPGAWDIGRC